MYDLILKIFPSNGKYSNIGFEGAFATMKIVAYAKIWSIWLWYPKGIIAWDAVIGWRNANYNVPILITWLLLVKLAFE